MWFIAVAKRFREHFAVVALVVSGAFTLVGCGDRETILVIEQPTEVHSLAQVPSSPDSSSTSVEPGKVIVILKAGESVKAVGEYHGGGHDAFHVKLADGTEGLILAGDTFKVVSR